LTCLELFLPAFVIQLISAEVSRSGIKRLPNIPDPDNPKRMIYNPLNVDYIFPPEKVDWKYNPLNFAARGRLYFNTNSEDLDYVPHYDVQEDEMLKDGCPGLTFPDDMEYPIISYPGTPD